MDATSPLTRRAFLGSAALAAVPLAAAADAPPNIGYPGTIVRQYDPENVEFPFPTLDGFMTPTAQFYVRSHFAVPSLDARAYRLRVEGAVERPVELSLEEIRRLPSRRTPVLLECSGNSRVFLVPRASGVPWELGAVGTAEWTGVSLAAVLEKAGVRDGAVEVILEGADSGTINEEPKSPGRIHYARSLPLDRARRPEVLLAYRMNGEDLTPAHGYPLRAVVPGWYGMASVKWLTRIIVTDRPFQGYFQTMQYAYFERRHGLPTLTPVTELNVKAQVARPARHESIQAGIEYRVFGAAWTGDSDVSKVEVSTDGGRTWAEARLLERPVRHAWRLWEYKWQTPNEPGRYTVRARATDGRGRTQPAEHDPDRRNTMISHVLPIEVQVRK